MLTIPMDGETTVYVSIFYLIANLLHERSLTSERNFRLCFHLNTTLKHMLCRAQEGLSSASVKYGRIKKLESVALTESKNTNAHHLLISHTRVVRTIQMMI
ncbi:hypothetical protein YC2023_091001 [Brassica napus]